jgi:hypothetical protein
MSTTRDPFNPPDIIPHEVFVNTPQYAELCRKWEIDPTLGWDAECLPSIEAARQFFWDYEQARRALSGWTAPTVAAYAEGVFAAHEADKGAMVLTDRHGPMLIVQDPLGEYWSLTAQPYDPADAATAMVLDQLDRTPPQ